MKKFNQRLLFLSQSLLKPRQMGAISPSSSFLASAMAKEIYLTHDRYVMELGGGTGSLTTGLLSHGTQAERLIIIEKNPVMVRELKKKFPACLVQEADAQHIESLRVLKDPFIREIDSIISGLPLRSLPKTTGECIVSSAFSLLPHKGRFIQFTYGLKSPISGNLLTKHHMKVLKKTLILRNFPPATVWVYEKQDEHLSRG
jgi:phosphatidylethanolamine/phosphatidyl-N-methylethanolamine N-methyltransferase